MRRISLGLALFVLSSCGGDSSRPTQPTQPSTPVAPAQPPPVVNSWSVTGTLVDTVGRQPIAGATIAPSWEMAAVQSGTDGAYELGAAANPPSTPYKLSITGDGLLSREVWVTWQRGARTGVVLDAIRDRPPFSLEFYRQFVRGTYDEAEGGPYANFRWMEAPRFYVKTVDQNGRAIEPEVMTVVREALGRAVREFTGGTLSVAALETGIETRAPATGWINVDIRRDPNEHTTCGFANIGANPGSITFNNDVCSCGSNKIPGALVLHEVGHALGFFHVPDRNAVMYPYFPGNCPAGQLTAAEKFHAAIAYSRPRGNRDPDIDPVAGQFIAPSRTLTMYH
jgi:hypothetical protein